MTTIKFRRDTSANWTSVNPIPAQGEPCYETDTGKLKIGNGSDNYVALPYVSDGGGSSGDLPIATATTLGGIKVGNNLSITEDGTLSANAGTAGTTDYTQLENKPQINSVELTGNKTLNDLGIQAKGNYQPAGDYATTADIPTKTSELTNDSGFLTEAPIPSNMVTTDTTQTISGSKAFSAKSYFNNGCQFTSSSYSDNYFKKGFKIGNVNIYNTSGNALRIGGSSTHFLTFNDGDIRFMSDSSTAGMNITDGVITTAYDKPYLKIKEYNDNTNTHNLEINCDTTNNNSWNIACGDQTFINTANIDTTYLKWDSVNKKLTVDITAVTPVRYPVEVSEKSLMPSWYVVYSDGWCEQGGHFQSVKSHTVTNVNLLKPYKNLNFNVNAWCRDLGFGAPSTISCKPANTNYIQVYNSNTENANMSMGWETKGFIA